MNQQLHIKFGIPEHGWLPVTITTSNQHVMFVASFTPVDSLERFITSLVGVLTTQGATGITWFTEPVKYEFVFVSDDAGVTFTIVEFSDHRRPTDDSKTVLAVHASDRHALVVPFWRALRRLQAQDGFDQAWLRPFPHEAMSQLTRLISPSRSA